MLNVRSEKYSVEVVKFVAEADGGYALAGVPHILSLYVFGADGHSCGAARNAEHPGNGKTALVGFLFADGFNDFGIYEFEHLAVIVNHNDNAAQNADLRSGKSQPLGKF